MKKACITYIEIEPTEPLMGKEIAFSNHDFMDDGGCTRCPLVIGPNALKRIKAMQVVKKQATKLAS